MDEMVFNSLSSYFNTLEKTGYMSYDNVYKLLVLLFYNDYVFNDYRGFISKEDYAVIERALYCLFGTTCLIPYPDYLKMGKLCLGDISELAKRVKDIEDTKVLKGMDEHNIIPKNIDSESDVEIWEEILNPEADTSQQHGTFTNL